MQKNRQGLGGAHPDNVDLPGAGQGAGGLLKALPVHLLQGLAQLFHVRLEHGRQHVLVAHPVLGDLDALHGGQTAADHFLQLPLHVGVAPEAQLGGEADHGGLAHLDLLAQAAGGHKRGLVVGMEDKACNALLSLGEAAHIFLDQR